MSVLREGTALPVEIAVAEATDPAFSINIHAKVRSGVTPVPVDMAGV
ncbi:MAG: hypothetical protein ACJAVR_001196 [Paracoccaceae bacterium]